MSLGLCIVISLLGMVFIPASPSDTTAMIKMVIAIVFIVLAWVLFALGANGQLTI